MISKKKGPYPKNFMKSSVSPQKLREYGWITPISVNFLGAQSSLGGHTFRLGGHGPGMPPMAPGLQYLCSDRRRLELWQLEKKIESCFCKFSFRLSAIRCSKATIVQWRQGVKLSRFVVEPVICALLADEKRYRH